MTIYLQNDFSGETATPQGVVSGVSLTGSAGAQTITGAAGTFAGDAFAVGRGVYIRGMSSGNGTYRITVRSGDTSQITLTPEGTPYSRSIPTFTSSSVYIRSGAVSTDLDSAFGSMQHSTQDNPCFIRIVSDSVYGTGIEKFTPKLKTYAENNGWQYFGDLSTIMTDDTDVWMAYWVIFLPGTSCGTLDSPLSAGTTSSLTFTLTTGDIADFPEDKDAPYSGTVEWNNREYAMKVLLGDPLTPGGFETIGYITRTGSGPYTLNTLSRGLEGTSDQYWAAGTKVTIGYDFNRGFKMPGFEAGAVPGRVGTKGIDFAQVRLGYVAYDWSVGPNKLGVPTSYAYNDTVSASFWWWGKTNAPAGYSGASPVQYKQNQWQCVEARIVMDTAKGAGNGQIHAWLDGVKVQEKTNVSWRNSSAVFSTWNWLIMSDHYGETAGNAAQKDERFILTKFTIADAAIDLYNDGAPPFGLSAGGNSHIFRRHFARMKKK